jgi:hypothetical protein
MQPYDANTTYPSPNCGALFSFIEKPGEDVSLLPTLGLMLLAARRVASFSIHLRF